MGIFGAMTAAVTGLQAQSYALENIAGNIANSQTAGFKRVDTSFQDFIPDRPPVRELAGGVTGFSRTTNTIQGDIQSSGNSTFMAVNGDGYFIVQKPTGEADGLPVFSGADYYTRRGDFSLDKSGYLVNGAGYYLKALELDPTTGNPSGSVPAVVQFNNDFLPARPTSTIDYRANLAKFPLTQGADRNIPDSELLNATGYAVDPTVAGTGTVIANDESTFLSQSISGGALTAYDTSGSPVNIQFRWAKISNSPQVWNAWYLADNTAAGTDVKWQNLGQNYEFASNGQLSPAVPSVTVPSMIVDNVNLGSITLTHGSAGLTQFADGNGVAQVNTLRQDGYSAGELTGINISQKGKIVANYSNGRSLSVASIPLANFSADNALDRIDGGAFQETLDSGSPVIGGSGTIVGASLESSNTDIADEFSKMIITQQAYAANTRIVSTSQSMIEEALNMVR
jgi:flagellar hook protein FlgE